MGLFSSKKKINVSSVVYNIAGEAKNRSQFLKENLTYLNAADLSVGENLPGMYRNSTGVGFKRAYSFAASLPQGLPTASMQLYENRQLEEAVQALLDAEHGAGIYFVEDSYFSLGGASTGAEQYLNNAFGWDSVTGEMTRPAPGMPFDADVQWAEYSRPMQGDTSPHENNYFTMEFRNDPSSVLPDYSVNVARKTSLYTQQDTLITHALEYLKTLRSDLTASRDWAPGDVAGTIETVTEIGTGNSKVTTKTTVITTTDGTTTSVRTIIEDTSFSGSKTFSHVLGLGLWPTLDTLFANRALLDAGFFPVIPLRVDNQDLMRDSQKKTLAYKQKIRLGKLLGADVPTLVGQINDNPNIKDIDHAFLVAGANMNTESQAEMDYLFRFWDMCRTSHQQHGAAEYDTWKGMPAAVRGKPNMNVLEIKDPQSLEKAYKITIEWNSIQKVLTTGEVLPGARIGQMRMVKGTPSTDSFFTKNNSFNVDNTTVTIMKQVSETQYEEIRINGAIHKNYVYEGKVVETTAANARTDADDHGGFLVPIFMPIFSAMTMVKRTQLSRECMYMVFNSYVVTKKKWYQKGIFKLVLAIVLIVVSVIAPWSAPVTTAVWSATMLGITFTSVILYALVKVAVGYVISFIIGKLQGDLVKLLGERWGRVFATVAAVVATIYAGGSNLTAFVSSGLQSAVNILGAVNQAFSAYTQGALIEKAQDFKAFMEGIKEKQKTLDEMTQSFFGNPADGLSVESLLQIQQLLREESPDVFLTRTLLLGSDVANMTLDMVSDMVSLDVNTRLPGIS